MPDLKKTAGYRYLHDTKFTRKNIREKERPVIAPGSMFKEYADAEKIELPVYPARPQADFWNLLQRRRSQRKFSDQPLSFEDLSLLLWATQGITARAGNHLLRTAPSAGALYPIETYLAADRIDGLPPGFFHFNVRTFQLERLTHGEAAAKVGAASLDQVFIGNAAVVFIWSAMLRRNMAKYGERGMRYICMDVGHICQNLQLTAEALERRSCPVAAIYDDELNALLGLDGVEESVIYLAPVG